MKAPSCLVSSFHAFMSLGGQLDPVKGKKIKKEISSWNGWLSLFLSSSSLQFQNQALESLINERLQVQIGTYQFAVLTPSLVGQESLCLFANKAAVTVDPLLPPHPTSITPSFGIFLSVRILSVVVVGLHWKQDFFNNKFCVMMSKIDYFQNNHWKKFTRDEI